MLNIQPQIKWYSPRLLPNQVNQVVMRNWLGQASDSLLYSFVDYINTTEKKNHKLPIHGCNIIGKPLLAGKNLNLILMGKFKTIFVSVVVILIAVFHNSYEPTKITFLELLASSL